ncbi:MAG: hypothetical protein QOE42_431 [Chloroflexota bacterium]|nr:hypothetical protein [Chloroflexota bacterium]
MSQRPISHSPDLARLIQDGFELEVRGATLLVKNVPYVDPECQVRRGTLVTSLELADDTTVAPTDHTARFIGAMPSDEQGQRLTRTVNTGGAGNMNGVAFDHTMSAKPLGGNRSYRDYHHKVTAYVARLERPVRELGSDASARTYGPAIDDGDQSPFCYVDTATQRAGLERYAERLAPMRLAIVGLGGTGSYILDLVAKCSVAEIHLYDGDRFIQHNAFRAPGSTPGRALRRGPNKAAHWARVYGRMRHGIQPHPVMIDATNVTELTTFDAVFVAIDNGPSRALILDALTQARSICIDVGLGINEVDERLTGKVRVSAGSPTHAIDRSRVPTQAAGPENDYRNNIQIVELNAMNAVLAVLKWKKLIGIYADHEREHFLAYSTFVNAMVNEDCA